MLTAGVRAYSWALGLAPRTRRLSRCRPVLVLCLRAEFGPGSVSSPAPFLATAALAVLALAPRSVPGSTWQGPHTSRRGFDEGGFDGVRGLGRVAGCWGFCRGGKPCSSSAASFLSCGCRLEFVPLFPLFSPFARVPSGFVLFSDA